MKTIFQMVLQLLNQGKHVAKIKVMTNYKNERKEKGEDILIYLISAWRSQKLAEKYSFWK